VFITRAGVRLILAIFMCLISAGEDVATTVRTGRELREKGKEHVVAAFFIVVPKIKIEIGHGGQSGFLQNY